MKNSLPDRIFSGSIPKAGHGHVQGIAVDEKRGFIYFSFTTMLLKTDLVGNTLGSVKNLAGHLGCITYDADENAIYGSLELKHDAIGQGIISRTGWDPSSLDSFYLVRFELEGINREGIDAEKDGIMTAVYLNEVGQDYAECDEASGRKHRYGCSGIDGVAYGPSFGSPRTERKKLMVAYGIYGENDREDNDYQVILQYDKSVFSSYALPLNQENPHRSGPASCEMRYFFYTGNTTYGVQNLEYDSFTHNWLVAVYTGKKEEYSNFPMFIIDGSIPPKSETLEGRGGEVGLLLSHARLGKRDKSGKEIYGVDFPHGATGIASMGNGVFYFSIPDFNKETETFSSTVIKYKLDEKSRELFTQA